MIIINKMYSGSYLDKNIGHEVINNYKSDNNKQYIYINPKDATEALPKEEDNYVIQVRCVNSQCFEVLSCAKIIKDLCEELRKTKKHNQDERIQIGTDLKYGGIPLSKIFEDQTNADIYAHFEVSDFKKCVTGTYLCTYEYAQDKAIKENNNYIILEDFKFGKQNLRRYVHVNDGKIYEQLEQFIKSDKFQPYDNPAIRSDLTKDGLPKEIETESIIDFVGKQNEELAFSNWLFKYLTYDLKQDKKILKKFISVLITKYTNKKVVIDDSELENLDIKREHKHTDIWIETKNRIIVIENKIDSDVTINQKDKENNANKDKENDANEDNLKRSSQLSRYYEQTKIDSQKDGYFFIFKPNTSNKVADLSIYKDGDKWMIIKYNEIYELFEDFNKTYDFKPPYMDEFLKALMPLIYDIATIVDFRFKFKIVNIKEDNSST